MNESKIPPEYETHRLAEQLLILRRSNFELRRDMWCKAVGVQRSRARHTAVLPWLNRHHMPAGFDHTGVYYWPGGKLHFLLTEPYHSTQEALLSLQALGEVNNGTFSVLVGRAGTGLWYPGACIPLLVAAEGEDDELAYFAAGLPAAVGVEANARLSGPQQAAQD